MSYFKILKDLIFVYYILLLKITSKDLRIILLESLVMSGIIPQFLDDHLPTHSCLISFCDCLMNSDTINLWISFPSEPTLVVLVLIINFRFNVIDPFNIVCAAIKKIQYIYL